MAKLELLGVTEFGDWEKSWRNLCTKNLELDWEDHLTALVTFVYFC
jgi:hypothetical protein